tara:strand:+ start:65 stop:256 length:192 start_codon:yes stop_codon:yes gene_type:complete
LVLGETEEGRWKISASSETEEGKVSGKNQGLVVGESEEARLLVQEGNREGQLESVLEDSIGTT